MRIVGRRRVGSVFLSSLVVLCAGHAQAANWQNGVDYGGGSPSMDLYVPDSVDESPGMIVALHFCGGSSQNAHGWFQGLADQHGFLIIAPDVGAGKDCWDAAPSRAGERADIAKMVDFVVAQEGVNQTRVFVAGASSGACMTQSLLASYLEVFAGGSVLAGVPAGAWTTGNGCCGTTAMRGADEWGDVVRSASPNFMGARPTVQLFHGTSDNILPFSHLGEAEKQWTNVHGVTDSDIVTGEAPPDGWERTSYADMSSKVVVEVNVGQGKPHDLTPQGLWPDVVRFFALDMDAPPDSGSGGADTGTGGADAGSGGMGAGTGGVGVGGFPTPGIGGAVDMIGGGGSLASSGGAGVGSGGATGANGAAPGASADSGSSDGGAGCQMGSRRGTPITVLLLAAGWLFGRYRRRTASIG